MQTAAAHAAYHYCYSVVQAGGVMGRSSAGVYRERDFNARSFRYIRT